MQPLNRKISGCLFVLASGASFALTPILGKMTYSGGSNAYMLTFLRALLALPVLAAIMKAKGISFALTKKQILSFLLLGSFGSTLTSLTLYLSYDYIPVGMATTLHLLYPAIVMALSMLFFKEPFHWGKIAVLCCSTAGVALFFDFSGKGSVVGVLLALLSAVAFAFVILFQYHSGLVLLPSNKLCFYLCSVIALCMLPAALLSGNFTLNLTPTAWLFSFIISLTNSIIGLGLLHKGLQYVGASTASILGMSEPVVSIFLGWLVLSEVLPPIKLMGCVLIFSGIVILTLSQRKN